MHELVFLQNDTPVTTSLKVAEVFGKRHDNVIQAINGAITNLLNFKDVENAFVKATYTDAKGEERTLYYLNRDAFTFVVMGFTGKKAAEFKWKYIQAFNAMERQLTELEIERRNEEWREVRQSTKLNYRKQTDVIQGVLIPLARAQGSTTSDDKFYMTYAKLLNKTLGIDSKSRDSLQLNQLYELDKMQEMTAVVIKGSAARGDSYKQIYQDAKSILNNYAQISMFKQRFIN